MNPTTIAQFPPLARVILFVAGVILLWLPWALPFYWLSARGALPGGDLIPTALLYVFFLGLLPRWQRQVHRVKSPWAAIGFTGRAPVAISWLQGLALGLASIAVLVMVQLLLGWATVVPMARNWVSLGLAGGVTAMAVGWAEEVLFRGWLLWELEQGWSALAALIGTSATFALAHFIKPLAVILATLPQFLGLLLLGLLLAWARRTPVSLGRFGQRPSWTTSLGYPAGLHSGLVWGDYVLNVGHLLRSNPAVPDWVTGLDGNPLAGGLGIVLLSLLAVWFYRHCHPG